jgi:hypothetical protein
VPVRVIESIPAELAIPKSATVTSSRSFNSRFRGLHVAVDDPVPVCGIERRGRLLEPPERARRRLGPVSPQPVLERAAGEVLHDYERPPFTLADVEDRDRAGLAGEARRGECLPLEALTDSLIRGVGSASTLTATSRPSSSSVAR